MTYLFHHPRFINGAHLADEIAGNEWRPNCRARPDGKSLQKPESETTRQMLKAMPKMIRPRCRRRNDDRVSFAPA